MNNQGFDESVQSLYFLHRNIFILVVLSFIILISVGIGSAILLRSMV